LLGIIGPSPTAGLGVDVVACLYCMQSVAVVEQEQLAAAFNFV
jgi:hypothetical protein